MDSSLGLDTIFFADGLLYITRGHRLKFPKNVLLTLFVIANNEGPDEIRTLILVFIVCLSTLLGVTSI